MISIFLFLFIQTCFCTDINPCDNYQCYLSNSECFNNILYFDHKQDLSNNFAINKKGEMILELYEYYDYDGMFTSRLFYGLTKDGKYFFSNQSSYVYELNIDINEEIFDYYSYYNIYSSYNSLNLFVSIKNADNKDNQYLFSINSYYSIVQMYKLNKENISYIIWNFNNFFNLDEDAYFFPYEYSIFELSRELTYIITFIPKIKVYEELCKVNFIKKFRFKSFDKSAFEEIKSINYEQFLNHTILSSFLMDDLGILGIISYLEIEENVSSDSIYFRFVINFYTFDLRALPNIKNKELFSKSSFYFQGDNGNVFYKSICLKNNQLLSIYSKYSDNYFYIAHYFKFELSQINYLNPSNPVIQLRCDQYETNSYPFNDKYISLTDYTKIDDKRIVFFYTSKGVPEENWKLVIIIIDIPPESDSLIITPYRMVLDNLEPNFQISGFSYNGFMVFASTFISENKNNNDFDDSNYYFSLFMIFGYPNGTDSIVDISYFLSDNENYRADLNFFNFLFENFTIENNFFGYIPVNNIKLVSIPKEILILQSEQQNENVYENGNENEEESIQYTQLGNNSFL